MRQVGIRPDAIHFSAPDLHPGGCTWSPALGAFIVTSQKQGKLVLVELDGRCVDLLDHPLLVTSMAVRERDGRADGVDCCDALARCICVSHTVALRVYVAHATVDRVWWVPCLLTPLSSYRVASNSSKAPIHSRSPDPRISAYVSHSGTASATSTATATSTGCVTQRCSRRTPEC